MSGNGGYGFWERRNAKLRCYFDKSRNRWKRYRALSMACYCALRAGKHLKCQFRKIGTGEET